MNGYRANAFARTGAWLLIAALLGGAVWLSVDLTRMRAGVSSVWIANGLLVGLLLRRPMRHWPALFAIAFAANLLPRLLQGDPLPVALGLSLANLIEAGIVAGSIRRRVSDLDAPAELARVARVATASSIVACLLSACLATGVHAVAGAGRLGEVWLTWFGAHLLGMVIVATLTTVALRLGADLFGKPGRRGDFAGCALALALACALVFAQDRYPLLFLVALPLLLLAFRHGVAGAVVGAVVIGVATGIAAYVQAGPLQLIAGASPLETALLPQLFVGAAVALSLPVAVGMTERRYLLRELHEREVSYRLLADHTRDLIVRIRADSRLLYISNSAQDILGWDQAELARPRWDLVHPDDRPLLEQALARLFAEGGTARLLFRVRHRDGRDVWLEALATRVTAAEEGGMPEVVYAARDISERVAAQQALQESRHQLQAVIDSIPAMVAHVDREERYTFVNAGMSRAIGLPPERIVGRTVREVRGEDAYRRFAPHIAAALRGKRQVFEGEDARGRQLQFHYVPRRDPDGAVRGFYALTFDITALKRAERELERLARHDPLTGLANRRYFEERLQQALVRTRRQRAPLALVSLDLDHFKEINDGFGHAAGDRVLQQFAERIRNCVYDVDLVARLGGDEFAVLVEHADSPERVETIARKLLAAMQAPIELDGAPRVVSASIGIGYAAHPTDAAALSDLADRALYAAKQAGRGVFRTLRT